MFDLLSEANKDDWLLSTRQTPKPSRWSEDGLSWDQIVKKRLSVLDAYPEIAKVYYSVQGDPVTMNGLPVAEVADMGSALVLRAQRVVIQQWKEDVPWASKGQVTVANGGDIGKEVGLYPAQAIAAQPPKGDGGARVVSTSAPPSSPAPASNTQGKIIFTSNRDSWDDVFVMNGDGSSQKRLTVQGKSYGGALSPDGTRVAYDSASSADKKRNYQIHTMNVDGSDVKRLTNNQSEDWYPSWSPDGSKIIFFSYRDRGWAIWIMNADGSDQRKLVDGATAYPYGPAAWSTNGTIAWGKEDLTVWAVNADGGGRRTLVSQYSAYPAWSPDGGRIAFSKYERAGGVFQIWTAK
ncbi:MAG: hypothetical protein M1358_18795, partial [Chloroflexi bacterium]|nr:hypothetical protein [Chloroflexota bacterium]